MATVRVSCTVIAVPRGKAGPGGLSSRARPFSGEGIGSAQSRPVAARAAQRACLKNATAKANAAGYRVVR